MIRASPEERTEIYWERATQYQRQQELLEAWTGSPRNKELIRAFQGHLFAKGSAQYRVSKLTSHLRVLCNMAAVGLDEFEKRDAEALVARINQREGWGEHNRSDHRRALKQFYRWFQDDDPRTTSQDPAQREAARRLYSYISKDVRSKPKPTNLDYSGIITDEDAQQIIHHGCSSPCERAMVAILHETGCRIGELLGMRLRDIERKDRHAMVRVDGKTGERRIPIIQSIPWLDQWLQDHPARTNQNALVWISNERGHRGVPLRYSGTVKLLRRVALRAGITKKPTAHWYRHSRATILAPKYSEAVLCKLMGWSLGSKQVRTYVHLGARQVEEEFLKSHGLADPKKAAPPVQFCVCGATNTGTARYCVRCGNALNVATFMEDDQKKHAAIEEATQLLMRVMSNPELRKQFEEYRSTGGTKP